MAEKLKTAYYESAPSKVPLDGDFTDWEKQIITPDAPASDPDKAPQATIESVDSEPSVSDAEEVAEELAAQPDAEVRYTDAEILGKRYPVRQFVNSVANNHMRRVEGMHAKIDNARDTPGKWREQFAVARVQGKYNRHKARLDAVEHLPDTHFLKRRRQAKLERVESKLNSAKTRLETRTTRMENRTKAVGENFEARRAAYIGELKGRKESALARKAMRQELRSQGASMLERKAILKDMPREQMQRVGRVAAQAETSRRAYGQAERQRVKASKQELKAHQDIEQNERRITQYKEEAANAEKTLAEIAGGDDPDNPIEGSLPAKEAHVAELQTKIDELAEDDPDRTSLQVQLDEAKHAVDIVKNREIPYWKSVAEHSAQRAKNLEYERVRFANRLESARTGTDSATATSEAHKQTLAGDMETLTAAAQAALVGEGSSPTEPNGEHTSDTEPSQNEAIIAEAEYRAARAAFLRAQHEAAEALQIRNNAYDAYNDANTELSGPNAQFLPEQQKKDYSYHRDVLHDDYVEAQDNYEAAVDRTREANQKLVAIEQSQNKTRRKVEL